MCWAALAEAIPLYPLYALLFADAGLTDAEISLLLAVWSLVGLAAEVPAGAWADRHSRRTALVLAGALQAAGHAAWLVAPGLPGFAAGFALWGVGGALASGSFEALLYEGLAAAGAQGRYAAVAGRAQAAAFAVQLPVAGAASALFAVGGYALAGWASVAVCLAAAALAARLPEAPRPAGDGDDEAGGLRGALATAAGSRAALGAVAALAALTAFDALEEYFPLMATAWGVPAAAVPLALIAVPLAGAAGSALGGRAAAAGRWTVPLAMLAGALALAGAGVAAHPAGLAAVALFYGLLRLATVVADARLQHAITGPSRATVTSLAGVASEVASLAVVGAWAAGGLAPVTALALALAVALMIGGRAGGYPRWRGRTARGGVAR